MDPVDVVRRLEQREAALSAESARLAEAQSTAEHVGERAAEIEELLHRLPAERARADASVAEAHDAVGRERAVVARLREAAEARGDESLEQLVHQSEMRAENAQQRLRLAEHGREELERAARGAQDAIPVLEAQARIAAATLTALRARRPEDLRPAPGLAGLQSWSARARAAAFVARSQVDRRREALVREAAETASSVLGEPFAGASVQVVRRRLDEERRRRR